MKRKKAALAWIWEFTKKVICIVTVLYVISFAYTLFTIMHYIDMTAQYATSLDTLITESNETFRYIVGGYLIKAGVENACKIITSKKQKESAPEEPENGVDPDM